MKLTDYDRRMLNGEFGEAKQIAMQKTIDYAKVLGAEELVNVDKGHCIVGICDEFCRADPNFDRVYSKMFLDTLIPKVIKKCELMPQMREMVDVEAIKKCKNFYDFDSLYTAPVHGFKSAMDYWTKASAKPWLKYVQVPLLRG